MAQDTIQAVENDWVSFPGGELEGRRPKTVCPACRERLRRAVDHRRVFGAATDPLERHLTRTVCFQCYRADLERERALRAAGQVFTGSEARFQEQLPFEAVQEGRLATLKAERAEARGQLLHGVERFADRRRRAQMAARRALQALVATKTTARPGKPAVYDATIAAAFHAAELQLPDSWLPFVMAR
jgi:hypothetical protein